MAKVRRVLKRGSSSAFSVCSCKWPPRVEGKAGLNRRSIPQEDDHDGIGCWLGGLGWLSGLGWAGLGWLGWAGNLGRFWPARAASGCSRLWGAFRTFLGRFGRLEPLRPVRLIPRFRRVFSSVLSFRPFLPFLPFLAIFAPRGLARPAGLPKSSTNGGNLDLANADDSEDGTGVYPPPNVALRYVDGIGSLGRRAFHIRRLPEGHF